MKKPELKNGFTLTEIIVVLAILAIIAGAAVPAYLGWVDHTKAELCKISRLSILRTYTYYHIEHPDVTLEEYCADTELVAKYCPDERCPAGGIYSVYEDLLDCSRHSDVRYVNQPNTNVFAGASASATNSYRERTGYTGNLPSMAFDSNTKTTRWATDDNIVESTLTVDLKKLNRVNQIKIKQYGDRIAAYAMEYLDPYTKKWVVFASGNRITSGPEDAAQMNNPAFADRYETITFSDIITAQVRVKFTRRTGVGGVSIIDMQAGYVK